MKKLDKWFYRGTTKARVWYELIKRSDKSGLFKLYVKETWMKDYKHVGWEVTHILSHDGIELFGSHVSPREYLPSDEEFGAYDRSKAFHPSKGKEAFDYFEEFDSYVGEEMVESY